MDSSDGMPARHSEKAQYEVNAKGRLRCGLLAHIQTRRSGSATGRGRSRTAFTTLNTAVLPPMPSASAMTASAVAPGLRMSMRRPNRTSWSMVLSRVYRSIFPQGLHGIEMRGAARRDITGGERGESEQRGREDRQCVVGRCEAEQHTPQRGGGGDRTGAADNPAGATPNTMPRGAVGAAPPPAPPIITLAAVSSIA